MARKLRVEYPGAIYLVSNRGDRQKPIFRDNKDRELFLETLTEAHQKTGWQVHAYCLMKDHFQLVVETPQSNLVAGMKWLLGAYVNRFSRRHELAGALFTGRYKALFVEGDGDGYFRTVCEYVHLHPAQEGLLKRSQPLSAYRWSSYPECLKPARQRPAWLSVERLLKEMGIDKDDARGRRQFEKVMEKLRVDEEPAQWKRIQRGWYLGSKKFREWLLKKMPARSGTLYSKQEVKQADKRTAELLVKEELARLGWNERDLARRRKMDPGKQTIALRLRTETVMTLEWIAQRLKMGNQNNVLRCAQIQ